MQNCTTWRTDVTRLTCDRTPLLKRPRCAMCCNAGQLLVSHTLAKASHDTRQRPSGTEWKLEENSGGAKYFRGLIGKTASVKKAVHTKCRSSVSCSDPRFCGRTSSMNHRVFKFVEGIQKHSCSRSRIPRHITKCKHQSETRVQCDDTNGSKPVDQVECTMCDACDVWLNDSHKKRPRARANEVWMRKRSDIKRVISKKHF